MQPLHAGARQATLAASFGGTAGAEYAARVAAADDRTTHEQNLAANPGLQHAQIWRRARAGPAPPAADGLARAIGIAQRSLLGARAGGDAAAAAAAAPADADADDSGTESDDPDSEEDEEDGAPPPLKIVPEDHAAARFCHDKWKRTLPRLVRSAPLNVTILLL